MARLFGLLVCLCLFLYQPLPVEAGQLVPCGGPGQESCQLCHFVLLINNVMGFIVSMLAIIAGLMIVYAGVVMVTSLGQTNGMMFVRRTLGNILLGIIIALAAWLIVDTVLKGLLRTDSYGVWNVVQCVAQPKPQYIAPTGDGNADITYRGRTSSSTIRYNCTATGDITRGGFSCDDQAADCAGAGGVAAVDNSSNPPTIRCVYPPTPYSGACEVLGGGPCSIEALTPVFGADAAEASRMCNKESGGNAVRSGSDLCCGPDGNCDGAPSFSGGYFQVNIISEADRIPNCSTSFFMRNGTDSPQGNCVRRNGRGICTGWSCSIVNPSLYNTCMRGALDANTNLGIARQLYNERGWQPWTNSANLCGIPF